VTSVNLILGVSFIGSALLVIGLAIPLRRGSIPPNDWYGVRVRKSLSSEENWYAINRYGADQLIIYGVELIAVGIALLVHLRRASEPSRELTLVLLTGAIGMAWDSVMVTAGWLVYPAGNLVAGLALVLSLLAGNGGF